MIMQHRQRSSFIANNFPKLKRSPPALAYLYINPDLERSSGLLKWGHKIISSSSITPGTQYVCVFVDLRRRRRRQSAPTKPSKIYNFITPAMIIITSVLPLSPALLLAHLVSLASMSSSAAAVLSFLEWS